MSLGSFVQERRLSRSAARLLRTQGRTIPWKHAALYIAIAAACAVAVALWDHAYEVHEAALFAPPPPPVLAKNLVEDIMGPKAVKSVSLDQKTGALEMTVQDALIKPGQSRAEQRKNVATEGDFAIQVLRSKMSFKTITLHIVAGARSLATVVFKAGDKVPTTRFASSLQ